MSQYKPIKASDVSMRTRNPIRQIVDNLKVNPNPSKTFISLALGDPTTFGNLKLNDESVNSVITKLKEFKSNGYGPSIGLLPAREAIAKVSSYPNAIISAKDVIITSGCSDALNLCIGVLCDEGQNILLPMPGFSLYETLASSKGVECKFYRLLAEKQWEIDLDHLESLIDENTSCILINNPSNPCGSNYSREHLEGIIKIAKKHSLPIIADEIYADMVFEGEEFIPLASITKEVPILSCGGLAKRFLVPGWRVGWLCIYDPVSAFENVRVGLNNLSQLIIGANTLIQSAIPDILKTEKSFHDKNMAQLEENARLSVQVLSSIPGLKVVVPQGSMYLMIEIDLKQFNGIKDDVDFVEQLVQDQAVLCLPGQCFRCEKPFVRIVFSSPIEILRDAYKRIREFCAKKHI